MQFPQLSKQFKTVPSDSEYAAAIARLRQASQMDADGNFVDEAAFLRAHKEHSRQLNERLNAKAKGV